MSNAQLAEVQNHENATSESAGQEGMPWYPHVTVATIVERDGKFLCVEEHNSCGQLVINQPAGHLDPDETLIEAAIRETREETAWEVSIDGVIGFYLYTTPHSGTTYMRCCFAATALTHYPDEPLDTGIERALWLSREELQQRDNQLRSPLVVQCIEDYQNRPLLPLDILHHS